jgi:ribosomal protein L11 methyltransferase
MRYFEVILDTPSDLIELRCSELETLGVSGFIIEDEADFRSFLEKNRQYWDYVDEELTEKYSNLSRIRFYFNDDESGATQLKTVLEIYPQCSVSTVQDSDWENNWREYYKPIEVGEKLIVIPQWEAIPENNRIPLILDPGLIFGTGSHATTKMCLQALEQEAAAGKRVLDLGCGSGILGIGALVLGCDSCCGVDIDPKAPDIACANAALNDIESERFRVYAGDVLSDSSMIGRLGTDYDIVLANIVADVIIALAPKVRSFMKKDAVFICSGIIDGREEEVRTALSLAGFIIQKHLHDEEWNAFVCHNK